VSETWSVSLREEYRLMFFKNSVLRKIFEPKRAEVTGEWRILHNKVLYDPYSSQNIICMIKSRSQGQVVGCCECSNELSDSIKCGEFLD
jgi:hypothetical protein